MDLEGITTINNQTLAYAVLNNPTSGSDIVGGLRREYPYFGLVEVDFPMTGKATMACFNDDAVVLEAVWNGSLLHERFSMTLWQALAFRSAQLLDIGAYTGIYAIGAVAANPRCRVIAFEPIPHIFARLIANVAINGFSGIQCVNTCVSDVNAEVTMSVPMGPSMFTSGASVMPNSGAAYEVPENKLLSVRAEPLDEVLARLEPCAAGSIGAIKIDVEMHEPEVLAGATLTLQKHRPIVLLEVLRADLLTALVDRMPDGYSARFIVEDEEILTENTQVFASSKSSMNALLIPDERLDEILQIAIEGAGRSLNDSRSARVDVKKPRQTGDRRVDQARALWRRGSEALRVRTRR